MDNADSSRRYDFDVAVLGAGAAGLFAGIRAAQCGARVIVLEKNRRAGVKILMSGGTPSAPHKNLQPLELLLSLTICLPISSSP